MAHLLAIVTNQETYQTRPIKTGLWLSELTHLYSHAKQHGHQVSIASPKGGQTPLDPESLKPFLLDKVSKTLLNDADFMQLLATTRPLDAIQAADFDGIYLTGGHGTMFDFPDNADLQKLIAEFYESGKLVSAVCHGVGGLLNVKLSDGTFLVKNKTLTGCSWTEEIVALRKNDVPFDLEDQLKQRGAEYQKSWLPLAPKVCVDGQLLTGQNPFSSKALAEAVMAYLAK
ncbi:type 1 glutamine amidotransferase domain-containing protein [Neisseria leonii]|uniref:Type 1 glutamine amidotransferase domain-containing protein n=1 Tax=Neisseria leonii TaxID=2995413 RepID=A0A9X4DZN5_9NEIS|nr:type 1 glutamine amidotransferase domain-containing protein [Neisseria sp. 51.81]MDD9326808.1 type 1 glutamine amidotransferase domain-containing protein [Neisseria sp. 51.81]